MVRRVCYGEVMSNKFYAGFLWGAEEQQSYLDNRDAIIETILEENADLIKFHDKFYAREIERDGLTFEKALREVGTGEYSQDDPNESTLPYGNAGRMILRHASIGLGEIPRVHYTSEENEVSLGKQWLCRLGEWGFVPRCLNRPMAASQDDVKELLSGIKALPTESMTTYARTFYGAMSGWCERAIEHGGLLVIYLIDYDDLWWEPLSRQIESIKRQRGDVPQEELNKLGLMKLT